jgi:quercetin dioxygenase-like cupin family protein
MTDKNTLGLLALVASLMSLAPVTLAGETPDLPHAFDAGWQGEDTCELIFENEDMRVARCVFPPGIGHEKHYHEPHFGYVLEGGTLRTVDSSGERVVSPQTGGSWSTSERTVHEAVNIGDATTSYLIVEPAGK